MSFLDPLIYIGLSQNHSRVWVLDPQPLKSIAVPPPQIYGLVGPPKSQNRKGRSAKGGPLW